MRSASSRRGGLKVNSFLFRRDFRSREGLEQARSEYEKERRARETEGRSNTGGQKRKLVLRDPRTRHPPIYITFTTRTFFFFESPFFRRRPCFSFRCLFAGLCSPRGAEDGTSRACNLILRRENRCFFAQQLPNLVTLNLLATSIEKLSHAG